MAKGEVDIFGLGKAVIRCVCELVTVWYIRFLKWACFPFPHCRHYVSYLLVLAWL